MGGICLQVLGGSSCVAEEEVPWFPGRSAKVNAEPHNDNCTSAASLPGNSMGIGLLQKVRNLNYSGL